MATAPIIETAGDDNAQEPGRDFEAEARRVGWVSVEDFKGDPEKHVDAKTFVEKAENNLPLLQKQVRTLNERLEKAEKSARQAADFFSKAEQRAYERAVSDIRKQQEEAVESGDLAAHRAASKALDDLEKPSAASPKTEAQPSVSQEEFAEWLADNRWYKDDEAMMIYADTLHAKAEKAGAVTIADLRDIAEKTKARFKNGEAEGREVKPRNAVDGGNTARGERGGKTFNDLPADAKAACDRWVKQGLIKSRDDYVKSYQWEK